MCVITYSPESDHLVGLVVKASASRAADPGFDAREKWEEEVGGGGGGGHAGCWSFSVCATAPPPPGGGGGGQTTSVGLVVKASALRASDPGFDLRFLRWYFSGYWHSSCYPAGLLVLLGQRWDWLAGCHYTITG